MWAQACMGTVVWSPPTVQIAYSISFAGQFPLTENQFPLTEIQFPLTEFQFPLTEN